MTSSEALIEELALRRNNMKEALCEFAIANGAKFDEVTLVEREAHDGTKLRWEYSIQRIVATPVPQWVAKFQEWERTRYITYHCQTKEQAEALARNTAMAMHKRGWSFVSVQPREKRDVAI